MLWSLCSSRFPAACSSFSRCSNGVESLACPMFEFLALSQVHWCDPCRSVCCPYIISSPSSGLFLMKRFRLFRVVPFSQATPSLSNCWHLFPTCSIPPFSHALVAFELFAASSHLLQYSLRGMLLFSNALVCFDVAAVRQTLSCLLSGLLLSLRCPGPFGVDCGSFHKLS